MSPKAFLLLLLLLPGLLLAQPQFAFEGEVLDFSLEKTSPESDTLLWIVSGRFYLSNLHHEALSRLIWFPVPASDSVGVAEDVSISLIEPVDSMSVELLYQNQRGFGFRLDLPARSFAGVKISYRQKICGSEARYVLLTANSWGRPLPSSEINLTLGQGITLTDLPYPDPIASLDAQNSNYRWTFLDFVPDRDFVVRFGCL